MCAFFMELNQIYRTSLSLLTDLYQLTMAYGYWKNEMKDKKGVFHLFFRKNPFKGGYTIACGLEQALQYIQGFEFTDDDLRYLSTLKDSADQPMFEQAFLNELANMKWEFDAWAVKEGTPVFPFQPIMRVEGPLLQTQILETPLLNIINYQTLLATKASRIYEATKGMPIMEFGLRRAQGIDGGLSASRAAHIGGCSSTSNLLAGKLLEIPVSGTHAHSWVMCFDSEIESFKAYASAMPGNCILLVDTYDVFQGVRNAIEVGMELKKNGKKLLAIRLDSGDLAYQSQKARKMLDAAGLEETKIVASNDLDEHLVQSLKEQQAKIDLWGIGTKLITAYDQPALGGVYKLSAIEKDNGELEDTIKLSEQSIKVNIPGQQQVRRYKKDGQFVADMIYRDGTELEEMVEIVSMTDPHQKKLVLQKETQYEDLLKKVIDKGKVIYDSPGVQEIRSFSLEQIKDLHPGVRRFTNPHAYPAGLEVALYRDREQQIDRLKKL